MYALIDYFSWKNRKLKEMVCNRLGFFFRLVLYWPHIGLIITSTRGMGLMSTQRSTHGSKLLAAAITLALSGAAVPVFAAQGEQIEEVIVTGIRGSLKQSLDTKREANAVVEAVTAEDLGAFPNTNVAEAMTQIPGVAIDRRFGQGERVSIDGTDPSLNLTYLDGHPVAQSIWLFGEQPNRGFDQTQIASEIIGRLEIYKSPEARLPEGSLGGTVLMHTRRPLDLDANTLSLTGQYNYNDQASEGKPSASGLYSWKNDGETYGIALAAQHYEEQVDRQGAEIFGYQPASVFTNVTGVDPNAQVPNFVNAAWFQQTRKRNSLTLNFQVKPSEALELNLSGLYIKEDFANYNQSMYNFLSLTPDQVDELNVGPNGIVTSGHSGPDSLVFYDNNVRESKPETRGLDLQAAYYGDRWSLSGQIGQSKADNDLKQFFIEPAFTGGFSWDIRRGITFDDPAAARDPANWVAEGFFGNNGIFKTEAKDTYGQADLGLEFDGMFNELVVGVRRHKHEEDFTLSVYGIPPVGDLEQVGTVGLTDIWGFSEDHGHHIYAGRGNVLNWVVNAPPNFANQDAASFLNNTFHIDQTNTSGYAQLNFGKEKRLHGNFGVRYVKAEIESTAYDLGSDVPSLPAQPDWLVTRNNDNDYVLPSLNVAFDATDQLVLRFAAAKVVAWAPYNQMAPNTFLNDTTLTGSGGNSDLGPYESTNYNLAAEWYFASESVLAASVFYKDIENFVETEAGTERQFNSLSDDANPGVFLTFVAQGLCTADGFCDYSILRPRNSGNGEIKGFNLSYQQPFGQTGFGVIANYTFADGETAAGNDLPFQSENQYNISPYYERGPLSARVTYGWRSEYLAGGFVAGAPPVSVDAYADLGLSLGWKFNETWQLNFDAQNLLDEEYFQYFEQKSQPANIYKTGVRYQASIQVKF
jgi:iron complex outermembrane recepter protein